MTEKYQNKLLSLGQEELIVTRINVWCFLKQLVFGYICFIYFTSRKNKNCTKAKITGYAEEWFSVL